MHPRLFRRDASLLLLCAFTGIASAKAQTAPNTSTSPPSPPTPAAAVTTTPALPITAPGTTPDSASPPLGSGQNGGSSAPVVGGNITTNATQAPGVTPGASPQNATAQVLLPAAPIAEAPATTVKAGEDPAPTTPTAPPLFPARGTLEVSGTAESLSVFAVSIDAAEILTTIAARAGLKLVVDDTISRRITIAVKDKPAREIIASIAGAYGLAAADVDGVTLVSEGIPRSPSSYLLSDIDQISTKYVDANNARNLLPVFLQDYVKVNSEQNAVVLSAPGEVLRKFRSDIAGFDIPSAQIVVDLLLVELTDTGLDQLNLNLTYQNGGDSVSLSPSQGTLSYRALTTLPKQFFAQLSALQEKGRARVRANPRIATVSGRHASIFVGRQRYIVTPIDTGQGQRNFIDAGVRLDITPYTGGEKQIVIDANAEVSTLSALDPVTRLPEKSTRTANTRVRVSDGQTIVIGGLKQQETRDVTTRVPILGNIPILGPMLFRSRNRRTTNSELVLFITPRILSDTGHLPAAEEDALKGRFLNPDLSAPLPPPNFDSPKVQGPFTDTAPTKTPSSGAPVKP
ncbi:type IV pilus biogenesis and competence protein PilQ [Abditibacteriota bacterium]|nr:type IV pilus biogenesis and competence protein PilQ [Abditibacteriota bacterium]